MIFNIGFNKSGTTSLTQAMEILGYKSIHNVYNDRLLLDIIYDNIKNKKCLFDGVVGYDFISDFVGQKYFKILDEQYPNSKFILTLRNMEDWLVSSSDHVIRNKNDPSYTGRWTYINLKVLKSNREKNEKLINKYFKDRDDLLIMNICDGDGWEKLCKFLNVDIPNVPFPYLNVSPNKGIR